MMSAPLPTIRKAKKVQGKSLTFRDATLGDAAFILSLRTDVDKSRYLSPVSPELQDQQQWLQGYAKAQDQAYFIIRHEGQPIGTVRLYDPQGSSFCWGSWVLADTRPRYAALESALMVYAFAVDFLGFTESHFDVRRGNEKVCQFHERLGAVCISETERDLYYRMDKSAIDSARNKYVQFLDGTVQVEFI